MYYIYRSPSSNNIVHVVSDKDLYSERMLLEEFEDFETVKSYAELHNKEICLCESNPIPHSLS